MAVPLRECSRCRLQRLPVIDGASLDIADIPANEAFFQRPGVAQGEQAAFPQARVVAIAECATHTVLDAVIGQARASEVVLAKEILARFSPGILLLADRGFYGFHQFEVTRAT